MSVEGVMFFGGTSLSRTHLADARLSEDIDLVALAPRSQSLPRSNGLYDDPSRGPMAARPGAQRSLPPERGPEG